MGRRKSSQMLTRKTFSNTTRRTLLTSLSTSMSIGKKPAHDRVVLSILIRLRNLFTNTWSGFEAVKPAPWPSRGLLEP